MIIPMLAWPSGKIVRIDIDNVEDITAPPNEERFCYIGMKTPKPFCPKGVGFAYRVAGSKEAVVQHFRRAGAKV